MAPETLAGEVSEQVDLWSTAVILYEFLAGRLPFSGESFQELLGKVLTENPDPLPSTIPSRLQRVVARGLEKDRARRYKTALEMRMSLQDALA